MTKNEKLVIEGTLYIHNIMTESERREQARQFIQKWHGKGREDEDDRSYWLDIVHKFKFTT